MPNHTIFLASKSPRRRELLTRLGYEVRVIASHTHTLGAFEGDETVLPNEAPEAYVIRTARNKYFEGLTVKQAGEFSGIRLPIVAADTVVSLENEILGKPKDFDEACRFLSLLSGRTHDVRTAVFVGFNDSTFDYRLSHSTVTSLRSQILRSNAMPIAVSLMTRRGATVFKVPRVSSFLTSRVAIQASWVYLCLKQLSYSLKQGSLCWVNRYKKGR